MKESQEKLYLLIEEEQKSKTVRVCKRTKYGLVALLLLVVACAVGFGVVFFKKPSDTQLVSKAVVVMPADYRVIVPANAVGPTVTVTFLGSDAGYTDVILYRVVTLGTPETQVGSTIEIFRGHSTTIGSVFELTANIQPNSEVVFQMRVENTGNVFSTGPVSRNPDGIQHARWTCDDVTRHCRVGFEDLLGGGDRDYNDIEFDVFIGFSLCGNGILDFGEQCDGTAGLASGETCTTDCVKNCNTVNTHDGTCCAAGSTAFGCPGYVPTCGDFRITAGETCDDGNTVANDGCSPTCQLEVCGDGTSQAPREECDAGSENGSSGSSCTGDCKTCPAGVLVGGSTLANCCANPSKDFSQCCAANEVQVGNGCCANPSNDKSQCCTGAQKPFLESGCCELVNSRDPKKCCDDANTSYGCPGYVPECGNGILDSNEECDDGNISDFDGCSSGCKNEVCGDGIFQPPREACDDGNTVGHDMCSADCKKVNSPPDCSKIKATISGSWPPDHKFAPVTLSGATDPDGDNVDYSVLKIEQNEPTLSKSSGHFCPDGSLNPTMVRIERNGDSAKKGRTYRLTVIASDGYLSCPATTVEACVPHDQSVSPVCVVYPTDTWYDSFACAK